MDTTTDFTFELTVADGTTNDAQTAVVSVGKLELPAPQGAEIESKSFPQSRPLTSFGIIENAREEAETSTALIYVTRASEDETSGEVLQFEASTVKLTAFRSDLDFPADIKANSDRIVSSPYLLLSSETADKVWIFPVEDPNETSFSTIDVTDPCLVKPETAESFAKYAMRVRSSSKPPHFCTVRCPWTRRLELGLLAFLTLMIF